MNRRRPNRSISKLSDWRRSSANSSRLSEVSPELDRKAVDQLLLDKIPGWSSVLLYRSVAGNYIRARRRGLYSGGSSKYGYSQNAFLERFEAHRWKQMGSDFYDLDNCK